MSTFNCPQCGTELIDTPGGPYITGCEHYPLDSLNSENTTPVKKSKSQLRRESVMCLDQCPCHLPAEERKKCRPNYSCLHCCPPTVSKMESIEGKHNLLKNQPDHSHDILINVLKTYVEDCKQCLCPIYKYQPLEKQTKQSYSQGREDGIREFLQYCKEHYWDTVTPQEDMIFYHLEQIQNKLLNQKKR